MDAPLDTKAGFSLKYWPSQPGIYVRASRLVVECALPCTIRPHLGPGEMGCPAGGIRMGVTWTRTDTAGRPDGGPPDGPPAEGTAAHPSGLSALLPCERPRMRERESHRGERENTGIVR